jgi:hypothetical protein
MSETKAEIDTQPIPVVDSEEIVDVPFSEATRMPMPERSYMQELLEMEIPLAHRIAHLIPYVEQTAELLSAHAIAQRIGADDAWVRKIAKRIGIKTTSDLNQYGVETEFYPPLSLELLEEEWLWYQSYQELDEYVSTYRVGEFVARGIPWVKRMASELNVYAVYKRINTGRMAFAYPKTLIPQLRHIILMILPEEDTYSLGDLSRLTGEDEDWIKNRLSEKGVEPERRTASKDNRIMNRYLSSSLKVVIDAIVERPAPAGEWLTEFDIAKKLSKSEDWVHIRLKKYTSDAVLKQSNSGKSILHYPPYVFDELKLEAEKVEAYPDAGDYLTLKGLARAVGKSTLWVVHRLPYIDVVSEIRLNKVKRPLDHYPPKTVNALLELPADILETTRRNIAAVAIVNVLNQVLVDTDASPKIIRELREEDSSIPSLTTIAKYFGSFEELNTQRGLR